ncbi:FAD/NAD(P)-binding domain-containing protein [Apiospora arundinis]
MHIDERGGRGRPVTSGPPCNDKEKELLGRDLHSPRTFAGSPFSRDGRLSPLPSSLSSRTNNSGIRCLSLSPAPSSRTSLVLPPSVYTTNTFEKRQSWAVSEYLLSTWRRNQGPILVCVSQFFGALMSAVTRLLELDEVTGPMHPMLILFWRMSVTALFSGLWTYYSEQRSRRRHRHRHGHGNGHGGVNSTISYDSWQDIVLGIREVRGLLVLRSVAGFFGLYGLWFSMKYLPLAEAVVISFLAPTLAGYLCHVFLHDRFTRREQLASLLALAGVVLIARPLSLFAAAEDPSATGAAASVAATIDGSVADGALLGEGSSSSNITSAATATPTNEPTPAERLIAILAALVGVLGGAVTFTTLRQIGTRAHTLVSVNYFSVGCVIVTTAALVLGPALDFDQPLMRFALPATWPQAGLLLLICVCGFTTQFLMTAGIAVSTSTSSSGRNGGGGGKTTGGQPRHGHDNGGDTDEDGEMGRPQMREYGMHAAEEGVVLLESLDGGGSDNNTDDGGDGETEEEEQASKGTES